MWILASGRRFWGKEASKLRRKAQLPQPIMEKRKALGRSEARVRLSRFLNPAVAFRCHRSGFVGVAENGFSTSMQRDARPTPLSFWPRIIPARFALIRFRRSREFYFARFKAAESDGVDLKRPMRCLAFKTCVFRIGRFWRDEWMLSSSSPKVALVARIMAMVSFPKNIRMRTSPASQAFQAFL